MVPFYTLKRILKIGVLISLISSFSNAQIINQTGFEDYSDEYEYVESSWESDGFTPKWVNGFNQSRCFIDDAYAQSGSKSLRVKYPTGGVGPGETGAQAPLLFSGKDEVYMSYYLRFSEDFDWGGSNEGGKLPGFGSGDNCSGGSSCDGTNGFSSRLMWRSGGKAVLYLYHMDKPATYGEDIDLLNSDDSHIVFEKGEWYQVAQRVKVNTENNYDGEIDTWINGELALSLTGLRLVNDGSKVDNLYFSTFHGGSGSTWAPSNDCHIWFDDVVIAEKESDVFSTICRTPNLGEDFTLCKETSRVLDANVSASDYDLVWRKNGESIVGYSNQTLEISEVGTYDVTASNENCVGEMDRIIILAPTSLDVVHDTLCEEGFTTISVYGNGKYTWYDNAGDDIPSNSGNEYEVYVDGDDTYFVEEGTQNDFTIGLSEQVGATWNTSNIDVSDKRIVLTVTKKVKLEAVTIFSDNEGTKVNLRILASDEETVLHEFEHTVGENKKNRVIIGQELEPGTYKFDLVGTEKSVHFETENSNYPLFIDEVLELNCNVDYQCNNGWYGFFYDWEFSVGSVSECRTPVHAVFDPLHKDCLLTSNNSFEEERIEIYPNPSETGVFKLTQPIEWNVFNSLGLLIKSGNNSTINLSELEKGIYLIRYKDDVTKIIIK